MIANSQFLRVFLCHASEDKPVVRELYQHLTSEGWLDVWFDEERLLPGYEWDMEIEKAVESADAVLVCISNKSVTKEGYIQRELRYALEIALDKPESTIFIIPLKLDNCVVPRKLRELQWVDYFPDNQKPLAYQRLLKSFKELLTRKENLSNGPVAAPTETEILASQAIRYELVGDFWGALQIYYKIKRIDPLFPRVDMKISELEREIRPISLIEDTTTNTKRKIDFSRLSPRVIAFFGFACLIFVGLLSSPVIQRMLASPSPSPTQAVQPTSSLEPSPIPEESPTAETTASPTLPVPTATSTIPGKDGMLLLLVPAGEFLMGSTGNAMDERPIHTVYLDAFLMDQTEVTNAMYAECVKSGICDEPRSNTSITQNAQNNSFYYGNLDFDNFPVIHVSWYDASTYCEWAGRRLPTEAEWEKAASWDDTNKENRLYPWGEKIDCTYANYYGNGDRLCVGDTAPVGNYPNSASFYGILDMAGNVWEWVADRYDPEYYEDSNYSNPTGPLSGDYMVIRGGSFLTGRAVGIRSSDRDFFPPDSTSQAIGFRCAMDASP